MSSALMLDIDKKKPERKCLNLKDLFKLVEVLITFCEVEMFLRHFCQKVGQVMVCLVLQTN